MNWKEVAGLAMMGNHNLRLLEHWRLYEQTEADLMVMGVKDPRAHIAKERKNYPNERFGDMLDKISRKVALYGPPPEETK